MIAEAQGGIHQSAMGNTHWQLEVYEEEMEEHGKDHEWNKDAHQAVPLQSVRENQETG